MGEGWPEWSAFALIYDIMYYHNLNDGEMKNEALPSESSKKWENKTGYFLEDYCNQYSVHWLPIYFELRDVQLH